MNMNEKQKSDKRSGTDAREPLIPEVSHFLRIRMAEDEAEQKQKNTIKAQKMGLQYEEYIAL